MNDSVREITATSFAPILYLKDVAAAIEFYIKAFDAIELHRWSNDDGSVHVAEMSIQTAVFHLHEEVARDNQLSPLTLGGASVVIGCLLKIPATCLHRLLHQALQQPAQSRIMIMAIARQTSLDFRKTHLI